MPDWKTIKDRLDERKKEIEGAQRDFYKDAPSKHEELQKWLDSQGKDSTTLNRREEEKNLDAMMGRWRKDKAAYDDQRAAENRNRSPQEEDEINRTRAYTEGLKVIAKNYNKRSGNRKPSKK